MAVLCYPVSNLTKFSELSQQNVKICPNVLASRGTVHT